MLEALCKRFCDTQSADAPSPAHESSSPWSSSMVSVKTAEELCDVIYECSMTVAAAGERALNISSREDDEKTRIVEIRWPNWCAPPEYLGAVKRILVEMSDSMLAEAAGYWDADSCWDEAIEDILSKQGYIVAPIRSIHDSGYSEDVSWVSIKEELAVHKMAAIGKDAFATWKRGVPIEDIVA